MVFYNEKEQLYLKTDASGVGLRACLLQNEGWNMVPKEWSTWQCNAVANTVCKQKPDKCRHLLQQYGKRCARHTTWCRKIPLLPFFLWGKCDHRPQTVDSNTQERCGKVIT